MRKTNNLPWLTLSLAGLAVVASAMPMVSHALVFDRTGILAGQWWRLVTGNWVHFSMDHLFLDLAAVGFAGWLIERSNRRTLALIVTTAAIAVGLATLLFAPNVTQYGGLSGVACALAGYLVLLGIERGAVGRWGFVIVLLLLTGKIAYEAATGQTLFITARPGTVVLLLAHLTGLLCGGGVWAARRSLNRSGNGSDSGPGTIDNQVELLAFPRGRDGAHPSSLQRDRSTPRGEGHAPSWPSWTRGARGSVIT